VGSATGILAERGDHGQRRNFLAALDDNGVVAKAAEKSCARVAEKTAAEIL
jgi:hypothetical protein